MSIGYVSYYRVITMQNIRNIFSLWQYIQTEGGIFLFFKYILLYYNWKKLTYWKPSSIRKRNEYKHPLSFLRLRFMDVYLTSISLKAILKEHSMEKFQPFLFFKENIYLLSCRNSFLAVRYRKTKFKFHKYIFIYVCIYANIMKKNKNKQKARMWENIINQKICQTRHNYPKLHFCFQKH